MKKKKTSIFYKTFPVVAACGLLHNMNSATSSYVDLLFKMNNHRAGRKLLGAVEIELFC